MVCLPFQILIASIHVHFRLGAVCVPFYGDDWACYTRTALYHGVLMFQAKQQIDQRHLQLQNLLYEVSHLQKEINKCLQFQ